MSNILLEISARHVHLNEYSLKVLFGENHKLEIKKELSQKGQFLSKDRIDIIGEKGTIKNIAVLGPLRQETQVEISATDARNLGIKAPIRDSGDLKSSGICTLKGPAGEISLKEGVIIAKRHAHMSPEYADKFGFKDGENLNVIVKSSSRSLIFCDVTARVSQSYSPAVHIDTDEANAANITENCYVEILKGGIF